MKHLVVAALLFLFVLDHVMGTIKLTEFEPVQPYRTIAGAVPVATYEAVSIIHCASFCGTDSRCAAITIDYDSLSVASKVECNILDAYVTSVAALGNSNLYYAQVKQPILTLATGGTTLALNMTSTQTLSQDSTQATTQAPTQAPSQDPTQATTLVTTQEPIPPPTTTSGTQIVDMVHGVLNACSSSSQKDFLVLTTSGVYFYDDIDTMTSAGPCGTKSYEDTFQGYTDLPSVSEIKAVLIHQSDVELYTAGHVRRWQIQSDGQLVKAAYSTQTIAAFLGTQAKNTYDAEPGTAQWAVRRARSSVERHCYFGNDSFVLVSEQWGTFTYQKSDVVLDQNNFNMNPFGELPSSAVAVTGYTDQFDINFAVVDAGLVVYSYYLDHSTNNNNPTKHLVTLGDLKI